MKCSEVRASLRGRRSCFRCRTRTARRGRRGGVGATAPRPAPRHDRTRSTASHRTTHPIAGGPSTVPPPNSQPGTIHHLPKRRKCAFGPLPVEADRTEGDLSLRVTYRAAASRPFAGEVDIGALGTRRRHLRAGLLDGPGTRRPVNSRRICQNAAAETGLSLNSASRVLKPSGSNSPAHRIPTVSKSLRQAAAGLVRRRCAVHELSLRHPGPDRAAAVHRRRCPGRGLRDGRSSLRPSARTHGRILLVVVPRGRRSACRQRPSWRPGQAGALQEGRGEEHGAAGSMAHSTADRGTSRRSATTQGSGGGHGRTAARRDRASPRPARSRRIADADEVRHYLRVFQDVAQHGPGVVVLLPRPGDADGGAAVTAPEIAGPERVASPRRKPVSAMVPTASLAPPRRQAQIQTRPSSHRAGDPCWHRGRKHGTLRGFRSRGSSGARRPVSGLDGPTICPPTDTKSPSDQRFSRSDGLSKKWSLGESNP